MAASSALVVVVVRCTTLAWLCLRCERGAQLEGSARLLDDVIKPAYRVYAFGTRACTHTHSHTRTHRTLVRANALNAHVITRVSRSGEHDTTKATHR